YLETTNRVARRRGYAEMSRATVRFMQQSSVIRCCVGKEERRTNERRRDQRKVPVSIIREGRAAWSRRWCLQVDRDFRDSARCSNYGLLPACADAGLTAS